MGKKRYSAALIGTGRIGFSLGFDRKREQPASHTMALKANGRIRIESACDSDAARLEYWHKFNKKSAAYSSYAHLFASSKPEIVVIAVNEEFHLPVCLAAIHAQPKIIILEKPVALTVQEALQIQEEAEDYGVPVLVNHERRFADDYRIAKEYMNSIGTILSINARLDSGLYVYNPEAESSGAYSLLHDGTHLADCVQYLLEDSPSEKEILFNQKITDIVYDEEKPSVVRNVSVHFESTKCTDITLAFSGKSRYFGFETDIIGTEGRIRIGNGIFELYKREESKMYTGFYSLAKDKTIRRPSKTRYFSNMVQNAIDFLDGKAPLRSTIQTGISTLKILESIKESIRKKTE